MTNPARSINGKKANSTRSRRARQGKYPSTMQKLAERKLITYGVKALNKAELELLSQHPYFTGGQRSEYAILAKSL